MSRSAFYARCALYALAGALPILAAGIEHRQYAPLCAVLALSAAVTQVIGYLDKSAPEHPADASVSPSASAS